MKKIIILLSFLMLLTLTSCSGNIIPKGYKNKLDYTNASIEQINNTVQVSIFQYDKFPNISKNKFLEKINEDTILQLTVFMPTLEEALVEYKFAERYNLKLESILIGNYSDNDYVYIDYKKVKGEYEYFQIYYLKEANNTLYYYSYTY